MRTGMRFILVGALDEKRSYDDKKTGERKFGAQVSWMGGSEFFLLSADQFKQLPEQGQPVQLEGTFKVTQFGTRYSADTITDPRVVAPVDVPQGRRASAASA